MSVREQQSFCPKFKRQLLGAFLSAASTSAPLTRRHAISSWLLCHWEKQYTTVAFENEDTEEAALKAWVRLPEQKLGLLTTPPAEADPSRGPVVSTQHRTTWRPRGPMGFFYKAKRCSSCDYGEDVGASTGALGNAGVICPTW